jgi:hypothetical protein
VYCGLAFETPEIPKPEIPKCWSHTLSPFGNLGIVVYCGLVFETPKSRNPETLKSRSGGPTSFHFSEFEVVVYCGLVFETLKVVVPHPFTFRNSEVVVYCGLVLETRNPEIPKPEIPKWWSHILSPFGIRELMCIVVWHLKPRNPETRNPEVVVPHPFTFQNSGVVVYGGLVFETPKSRNLKS